MKITINSQPEIIPDHINNITDLLEFKKIPSQGTAIALNNRLIKAMQWKQQSLNEGDSLTIISAAYGG